MKKQFTKLLAVACCLLSTASFAQLTPEVLYYDFNGTGTTVPNLASAPPVGTTNATIMGGVTQGGNGICRGTLIGTGASSSSDYLNTGWVPNLGSGSWTIAWRSEGIAVSATLYYIFGDANTNSFRCFTNGVAFNNNWILRGAGITDASITGGAQTYATSMAYVYDSGTNTIYGYLNGVLNSTTVQAGTPNITGAGPFKVMGYGTNVGAPAGGMMDEFRVYSRALTAAEVAQLANPFTPSGFLGADVNFCSASTVTLDVNWPASTVAWSTGSTFDTTMVSNPGTYTVSVSGDCGTGMDTLVINDLRTSSSITVNSCTGSYTAPSGAVYTMSGTYMDTIQNMAMCDSIITINAAINSSTTSSISATACSSYTAPSGTVITASGTYNDTIPNITGCDSIITIALTVNVPTTSTFAVTACGMYSAPSGAMIMSSGTYMDTIANVAGCDSVMTINVVINQPSASTISATACGMYTAPSGAMYMMSGTYMDTIANMAGCDSVITINLTINNATTSSMTASACGSYTAPSGAIYTIDGVYNDTIANMAGCDSVITITLTVVANSTSSVTATACNSYTAPSGAVYTASGTYMDTIANAAGCDSIITVNLQVTPLDTSVTVIGIGTLQATQSGASYQWLDCNNGMAPVAGATTQMWTPFQNGSYACIVTNGNCSDTSGCHQADPIGINESAFGSSISVYPNPNSGNFTINLGNTYNDVTVVITDLAGRVVYSHIENSTNMIPVQFDAAAGSYVVTVTSGENRASFRMNKN